MIKGSGIDIIEIDRIKKAIDRNINFINRIFTSREIEYINKKHNNINTIAGIFAAKEAVSKALGSGISGFKWTDIEIKHKPSSEPYVALYGRAKEIAENNKISNMHITISHSKDNAIAFAIAEENHSMLPKNDIDIEIKPGDFTIIDKEFVSSIIPERKKDSHKGNYGKLGIIGGSRGMTGAVALATIASLRSGSGLVYSIVPASLSTIIETLVVESITIPIDCENKGNFIQAGADEILEATSNLDCLVLGPGMGKDTERISLVKEILSISHKPIVLDADGINCIAEERETLTSRTYETIITPHPRELSRLLDINTEEIQLNRIKYCKQTAKIFKAITVLKGANTIIASPEGQVYINTTGNPGMATAGSGDVLSGIIGSFIGQGIRPLNAAIAGVFIHGLAGDMAAMEKGEYGLIAGDIVNKIPSAIKYIKGN